MTDRTTPTAAGTDTDDQGAATGNRDGLSGEVDGSDGADGRYRPSLGDLSHGHPRTDERFGRTGAYTRGPTVTADGGARREGETVTDDGTDGGPEV